MASLLPPKELEKAASQATTPSVEEWMRQSIEKLRDHDEKIKSTNDLMVLGFKILLLTLGGIVVAAIIFLITVVFSYKDSINKYNDSVDQLRKDQYQFLDERLNYLEREASQSGR